MKFLYLIAALVVLQIGVWAFAPAPPPKELPKSDRAYGSNENIFVEGRVGQRKAAMATLERPTGSRCTPEGHKAFISGLYEYYYQRQNEIERYPETFGRLGADYIAQQWSSTYDKRIDRLTQEAYRDGYLNPDELQSMARKAALSVVKGERVVARGCAG
jgi:hypothetical protein